MRHRLCLSWAGLLLGVLLPVGALAQDAPAEPESDPDPRGLAGHLRHTIRHNPAHPAAHDASRFHTNRESPVLLALPGDEDSFTFAVFGDRTGGPADGVSVLADAVHDVNLLEPDLVMTVGDLIQGYNQTDAWMEQMREYHAIMERLLCPWFPVAGNHDIYWRGEGRPPEEHEGRYEMHFGPLWYAFEHRDCFFVVLYSDEPDPDTGVRNFNRPESQRMSPEQLTWLEGILETASDARHVFVFLHHPRWLGNNYGDDWDKVHDLLVAAGNVSGVFAGHIHYMRYDPRDGIEYFALATVGGGQSGLVPDAGYLHQFHLVTVRQSQVAVASVPVGDLQDPRAITGAVSNDARVLARTPLEFSGVLELADDGSAAGELGVTVVNPASHPIEVTLTPGSADSRWVFSPDHDHATIEAGEQRAFAFAARRPAGTMDDAYRPAVITVQRQLLAGGYRFDIPARDEAIPTLWSAPVAVADTPDFVLLLDGDGDALRLEPQAFAFPDGPFTLECWMLADRFGERVGLVCNTESSGFGLFVGGGRPAFFAHLNGRYVAPESAEAVLEVGRWHHVAGVFDGSEVRLYVDGVEVAALPGGGRLTRNTLPLLIGADVDGYGRPNSGFRGAIDGVRLSSVARYAEEFEPARDWAEDDDTVVLLRMDREAGPWVVNDAGDRTRHATRVGDAALVGAD